MSQNIVIGIDGGGTYTRVAVADLFGNILGFSKNNGSHPGKNKNAKQNVKMAIIDALKNANQEIENVSYVVGGLAGLNKPEDIEWAKQFLEIDGLNARKKIVNDAEVAQFGAFLGGVGVLAIAGTGSIVLGRTESGAIVKNYDFHHDSEASARFLSYSVIYEIITQRILPEDQQLVDAILAYWEIEDIDSLRTIATKGFLDNHVEAIQKLSKMATLVTDESIKGNKIAHRACEKVVTSLMTGVQLVSSTFISEEVPVAFVGGVASNPYIDEMLQKQLVIEGMNKRLVYSSPQLSPVLGAVLYTYHELGIDRHTVINKLTSINGIEDYS